MNAYLDWFIPGRVVYAALWDTLGMDAMPDINRRLEQMLAESLPPSTHVLIYDERLQRLPTDVEALRRALPVMHHPQVGYLLFIGESAPVVQYISYVLFQRTKIDSRRFVSDRDAVAYLKRHDPTLPWPQARYAVLEAGRRGPAGAG